MLVLKQITLKNPKEKTKIIKLLRSFSRIYVKSLFRNFRDIKNKEQIKRLLILQDYIQNTYNIKQDILHIILNILNNIKIDNYGLLYINKEQVYTIKISKIYNLICFGNLEVQKSAIFYDAINYAMLQIRKMRYYGC